MKEDRVHDRRKFASLSPAEFKAASETDSWHEDLWHSYVKQRDFADFALLVLGLFVGGPWGAMLVVAVASSWITAAERSYWQRMQPEGFVMDEPAWRIFLAKFCNWWSYGCATAVVFSEFLK